MERDFLGLSLREPLAMVKEEVVATEGSQEIGFAKGSGNSWPFTNKVSAVPHLLSFKAAQEDKTKKIVSDPLAPSAFMSFSSANNVYDPSKKHTVAEVQKSPNNIRQDGGHFSLNTYSMQQDVQSMYRLPVPTNHTISISMGNPAGNTFFGQSQYSTISQGMASTIIKPQVLGGVPIGAQQSTLPSPALGIGNGVKVPSSGAQLTIFYAGTVNVYDDVSPEKAQAIMLLAGNGSSPSANTAQPTIQVHTPTPKPVAVNVSPVNQSIVASPCSRRSSPISISSNTGAHSGSGSTSTEEVVPAKTTIVAATPVSKLEPSTVIGSITTTTTTTTTMMPSVPQARKASLARFLEKRKERVLNVSPYTLVKKSPDCAPLDSRKLDVAATPASGPTTISFFGRQGN